MVEVRSTGKKIFIWRRNVNGKTRRVKLGDFPVLSVAAARKKAFEYNVALARGEINDNQTGTLKDFFEKVFKPNRFPALSRHTHASYTVTWRYLEMLHDKPMDRITRRDIADLHNEITQKNSPAVADRMRSLLSSLLNYACGVGHIESVPVFPAPHGTKKRERWLNKDEIKRFLAALEQEERIWKDYFQLLLFTGARKTEVTMMRWDELDLGSGIWRRKQKGGSVVSTALGKVALEILQHRQTEQDKHNSVSMESLPLVFPSSTSKTGYLVGHWKTWKRICKNANIEGAVIHTLRHTFASWAVQSGVSLVLTGKQLGHKQASTTERYSHFAMDQSVARAVSAIEETMLGR